MENISKPVIFIGSGRSGTTIISEIVFSHEDLAWPSNYQEYFPSFPLINLFRIFFDNRLWHFKGQKRQLNKVSALNKILFKPAEAYPKAQLAAIDKAIADAANKDAAEQARLAKEKELAEKYAAAIAKGDAAFGTKTYENFQIRS